MKLCEVKKECKLNVEKITINQEKILRRLNEIGIKQGSQIRFIKNSRLSKCILVESMGSVFILDNNVAEGIICHE